MRKLITALLATVLTLVASPVMADQGLPDTIPIPVQLDGFTINIQAGLIQCVGHQGDPGCEGGAETLWDARYQYDTPYDSVTNAGWWGGDREAYACAYMFLQRGGSVLGDVIFAAVAPPQQQQTGTYAIIKDEEMAEGGQGGRYLSDASLIPSNLQHAEPGECPGTSVEYEMEPTAHVEPRIAFFRNSHLVEIRDYRTIDLPEGHVFNVIEVINTPFQVTVPSGTFTVKQRVTVAEFDENGQIMAVVYYDARGTGRIQLDFPT